MSPSSPLRINPTKVGESVNSIHPNDMDLTLQVLAPADADVRLETEESAYRARKHDGMHAVIIVPQSALKYRMGRMDLHLSIDERRVTTVVVELLARAATADENREMVEELARSDFAALVMPRAGPKVTPEGHGEPDRVENLKEASRLFREASNLLAADPPTQVREVIAETPPGARLTAAVIRAVTTQPATLQPVSAGPNTLPIRGRHYVIGSLHAPVPTDDTDTPANRFTHGVGMLLERLAHETMTELAVQAALPEEISAPLDGYVTIRQLTMKQVEEVTASRMNSVQDVIHSIRQSRARLNKFLPVRVAQRGLPMNSRVLQDSRYARVRRTLDLLRSSTRDHYGPEGLVVGIRNLTTLYELYCAASLHNLLLEAGWRVRTFEHDPSSGTSGDPHRLMDGEPFPNTFHYQDAHGNKLLMQYEPRITRTPHPLTGLTCISATTTNLTPDIVITAETGSIILDAKLQPSSPRDLLPEAVLKYLHGIQARPGKKLHGLHLLHYSTSAQPFDQHDRIVTPAIGTIPVHPRKQEPLRALIHRYMSV